MIYFCICEIHSTWNNWVFHFELLIRSGDCWYYRAWESNTTEGLWSPSLSFSVQTHNYASNIGIGIFPMNCQYYVEKLCWFLFLNFLNLIDFHLSDIVLRISLIDLLFFSDTKHKINIRLKDLTNCPESYGLLTIVPLKGLITGRFFLYVISQGLCFNQWQWRWQAQLNSASLQWRLLHNLVLLNLFFPFLSFLRFFLLLLHRLITNS